MIFFSFVAAFPALRWLQYHDKDTGDLCGTLPLAPGQRVALTVHLDRSPEKLLLKGATGRVHSWVWPENDQLPKVVYVKFDEATWQLDGIDEPGVYPIHPITKPWYLDKSRQPAVLLIRRTQIPLTPAYAMTAHSSQGKTLSAVLLGPKCGTAGGHHVWHRCCKSRTQPLRLPHLASLSKMAVQQRSLRWPRPVVADPPW